jgi:hypothetical protein
MDNFPQASSRSIFRLWPLGWLVRAALICILFFASATVAMAKSGKLALVVGNQAYQHVPRLTNPGNDARGVADALRRLGFEVTLLTDVNTDVFNVVLGAFAAQAKTAEAVVFYYSGHAFQMEGQNHLLPVSAMPDANGAVTGQTWRLDTIVAQLQTPSAQTLIFLDACRTSPIQGRAGVFDGLAQMQTRAGTFISFATRPGAVSFDRDGQSANSPYTAALLGHMEKPGLSVSDLMIRVRNDVEAATAGQQTPWDQSSLRAQFFFNPTAAASTLPVFEIAQSDTIISPPPGGSIKDQIAALEPPKPGPVIQRIEAQDQKAAAGGALTRAAPVSLQPVRPDAAQAGGPSVAAPVVAATPPARAAPPILTALPNPEEQPPPGPAAVVGVPAFAAAIPSPQPDMPKDLPRAVQTELKRIGCYNMRIDGDWGNGSRRALTAYMERANPALAEGLEPTAALYQALLVEPEGICPPVVARSAPKAAPKKVVKRSTAAQRKPATTSQAKTPQAAAPKKKGTNCAFLLVAIVCK